MTIVWIDREEELPPRHRKGDAAVRVMVFSPEYPPGHEMRYRIVDSQFVRIMTDATHWTELSPPDAMHDEENSG